MAVVYLVICATCMGSSVMVATGAGSTSHASGWGLRTAWRGLRDVCFALGEVPPASLLVKLESWKSLSDELSHGLLERGIVAGRNEACAGAILGLAALSLGLWAFSASPLGLIVGVMGSLVAVPLWYSTRQRARERALIDEMPEVFRTLAMALGSGETLTQAVEYVGVHTRGYAREAFVRAAMRLRCGASTEEAMAGLSRELDAPGVGLLTTALVIAQRTGSPLRGLFQSSAQLVERQGEYERMLAVKTAQVRLSVRIVCLLPLVLVFLLSLISVDFQHGVTTLPGMVSLLVAAGMDGCALLIIRHLMRGVL